MHGTQCLLVSHKTHFARDCLKLFEIVSLTLYARTNSVATLRVKKKRKLIKRKNIHN